MILHNAPGTPSVEDLAVGINAVSSSIENAGHGERLLCAVFAFDDAQKRSHLLHLQLQARLLVPVRARPGQRPAAPHRARAAAEGADGLDELPMEPELERWFPALGHTDLRPGCRRSATPRSGRSGRARPVSHGLDVVPVGIEHEGAVVALGVLRPEARERRCRARRPRARRRGRRRPVRGGRRRRRRARALPLP